jgi:UDP-glucose:glycoprotein glucosyltransferase
MAIDWMNDLEMDSKYANWPSTLAVVSPIPSIPRPQIVLKIIADWSSFYCQLLRGVPPGSLPQLRRNLFNVVLSLDLSTVDGLQTLVGPINSFVQRGLGLRFGVVDVLEGEYDPGKLFLPLSSVPGRRETDPG